jgi:uncharacterized protein YndB with AHSA1/START domain
MTAHISASRIINASPDDVFTTVTDVARLPEWNAAISAVIHQQEDLDIGAEWVVEMHAFGQTWHSRSVIESIDPSGRCFAYRSVTDDGNPSYALWTWIVADHPDGALVTVAGELHPHTFWRRVLLVHIRSRQLAHTELTSSLAALGVAANHAPAAPVRSDIGDPP